MRGQGNVGRGGGELRGAAASPGSTCGRAGGVGVVVVLGTFLSPAAGTAARQQLQSPRMGRAGPLPPRARQTTTSPPAALWAIVGGGRHSALPLQ